MAESESKPEFTEAEKAFLDIAIPAISRWHAGWYAEARMDDTDSESIALAILEAVRDSLVLQKRTRVLSPQEQLDDPRFHDVIVYVPNL